MRREHLNLLKEWRISSEHLPILLRGARQVGKTYLVRDFAEACFTNIVEINFELSPECCECFNDLNPKIIINRIEIMLDVSVKANETLLFLDEVQACPNAIVALRYFKELMPDLHVIAAGSLLEFALHENPISMPVGRVQYLYLKQISFREYLYNANYHKLLEYIQNVELTTVIPDEIHEKLISVVREYMIIGGMPQVVSHYINNKNMRECQNYQTLLLRTYSDDFAKYAPKNRHQYLQLVYDKTPGLVSAQIQYTKFSADIRSSYLKDAIADLRRAGVIMPIYSTTGSGLPFNTHANEKKFKLLFLDVGLVKRATKLDIETLFSQDLMLLNRGALAEQFVGQELLAYQDPYDEPALYFWARDKKSSSSEVDYLYNLGPEIIPIEVKAGKTGSLKSIQLFMQEYGVKRGLRISAKPLAIRDNIISIPFYLLSEIPRLLR